MWSAVSRHTRDEVISGMWGWGRRVSGHMLLWTSEWTVIDCTWDKVIIRQRVLSHLIGLVNVHPTVGFKSQSFVWKTQTNINRGTRTRRSVPRKTRVGKPWSQSQSFRKSVWVCQDLACSLCCLEYYCTLTRSCWHLETFCFCLVWPSSLAWGGRPTSFSRDRSSEAPPSF